MKTSIVLCCDECNKPFDKNQGVYRFITFDEKIIYLCENCFNKLKKDIIEIINYMDHKDKELNIDIKLNGIVLFSVTQSSRVSTYDKTVSTVFYPMVINIIIIGNYKTYSCILTEKGDRRTITLDNFIMDSLRSIFTYVKLTDQATDPTMKFENKDVNNNDQCYI